MPPGAIHDLERHLPRRRDHLPVAAQRGQTQVAATLLALPHDRPFAAQVEVDLGELEPVGRLHEGVEPGLRTLGGAVVDQPAHRLGRATTDASSELMQLRDAEPARVEHHHHGRVRNVDADLDHGRCDEHVDLTRSERLEDRRLLRRGEASVQAARAAAL